MRPALVLIFSLTVISVQGGPISERLRPNTAENIERLRNLKPTDLKEELSGQFEGDIVLTETQEAAIASLKRNGLISATFRWPNNEIPYEIAEGHFSPEHLAYIERGLRIIEQQSCLRFRPRKDDTENYIRVIGNEESGCWSWVGNLGEGMQELHLDPDPLDTGCFRLATIVHEFLHSLGFYHMQSAPNRDEYVDIILENIQEKMEHNFNIYSSDDVSNFNVKYDYGSVMHYGPTAFSKNGEPTIVPKDPNAIIGQRIKMSERDISKLNIMYRCLIKT